ncbi:hypothetical protein ACI65C_006846 [Semiaphis heraclei]
MGSRFCDIKNNTTPVVTEEEPSKKKQKPLATQNDTTRRRHRRKRSGEESSLDESERKMDKKIERIKSYLLFLEGQYKILIEMYEDNLNNNI